MFYLNNAASYAWSVLLPEFEWQEVQEALAESQGLDVGSTDNLLQAVADAVADVLAEGAAAAAGPAPADSVDPGPPAAAPTLPPPAPTLQPMPAPLPAPTPSTVRRLVLARWHQELGQTSLLNWQAMKLAEASTEEDLPRLLSNERQRRPRKP